MIPSRLCFRRLKQIVSIEQVLAARGLLAGLHIRGDTLVGPCPIHHGDNPRAFVVSRTKNLWHCFTGCDSGGDIVELVRRLDHSTYLQAAHYLAFLAGTLPPSPSTAPPPHSNSCPFSPFVHRLALDSDVPFLREKGIHPQTARRFETGLYHGPGFLRQSIAVRLHSPEGLPLGYAARRLDPHEISAYGKWNFPHRLPKSELLYNFHRIQRLHDRTLVLVECPWSVMRLDQIGIPAVALLGTHLSDCQRNLLLCSSCSRVIIMMDADPAGTAATLRICQAIETHKSLRVACIPDGLDPDDLADHGLAEILQPFLL